MYVAGCHTALSVTTLLHAASDAGASDRLYASTAALRTGNTRCARSSPLLIDKIGIQLLSIVLRVLSIFQPVAGGDNEAEEHEPRGHEHPECRSRPGLLVAGHGLAEEGPEAVPAGGPKRAPGFQLDDLPSKLRIGLVIFYG